MKYAIYDAACTERPYVFQDQNAMTHISAVFDDKNKAEKICDMMNAQSTKRRYIVSRYQF